MVLIGNYDQSSFVKNNGDGTFEIMPLPVEAQIAPVNGLVSQDVNSDGFLDVILIGNDYGNEIFTGRLDALVGLVLLGDGNGAFRALTTHSSGFLVPGDGKALIKLTSATGSSLLIGSQNRGPLVVFKQKAFPAALKSISPSPQTMAVIIEFENGKKQRVETSYGAGFLSQSSRTIPVPANTKSITMIDYKGNRSQFDLAGLN